VGGGIAQGARMLGWVSQAMQDKQAHQVAGGAPVREGEGLMLQVYCAAWSIIRRKVGLRQAVSG
jgi:hypothetical protein